MLRAIIISPDQELGEVLENQLAELGDVGVTRRLDRYPDGPDLVRHLRAHAPHVIFLSIESLSRAFEVVSGTETHGAGVQIVAVGRVCEPQVLLELMRSGIREFVPFPFDVGTLQATIARVSVLAEKKPLAIESSDLLFSFLPSKAGVGTSTIALNAAMSLARLPDVNVLLADLDLNSGMLRFMLKLENTYAVTDACEHALRMDEDLWRPMVTSFGRLDVLHAGKLNPGVRIEASQVRHLLEFVRRNYKAICVDLSGNLERYSIEIMDESRRVFLVCTPEVPSLHLARERYNYLRSLDLGDRVSVLLNRSHKRSVISASQIEDLLGVPVLMTFPNDYQGVHKALGAGKPLEANTDLGKQFAQLAKAMLERKGQPAAEPKKRFVEYFSILPARYQTFPDSKKPAG